MSDQSYIKLGEDLFSEKSISVNSSGLIANEHGAFHHGRFWKWENLEQQVLIPAEPAPELESLAKKGQGLIGLTDAYIKSEKSRKQPGAGNGRP